MSLSEVIQALEEGKIVKRKFSSYYKIYKMETLVSGERIFSSWYDYIPDKKEFSTSFTVYIEDQYEIA